MKKFLAMLLTLAMVLSLAACGGNTPAATEAPTVAPAATEAPAAEPTVPAEPEREALENYEFGVDYTELYDAIGKNITIDMVEEFDGLAYVEYEGVEYELGMDFLSMAMVYNCDPIADNEKYDTADEIYNEWWKLYIQRWNYLIPAIPLYSNQYYHVYNAKIQNYEVTPYWGATEALVTSTVDTTKGSNSVIVGNTTEASGSFRYYSFGVASGNAADSDIQGLTTGLATVTNTADGAYVWNPTVVEEHTEAYNEDGSKTFTIKIYDDLKYSDGSAITAKDYLGRALMFGTPVFTEASGQAATGGQSLVGFKGYAAYDGTNEGATLDDGTVVTKYHPGYRLIDDYTFSVTVSPDYLPYYYDITYASFGPNSLALWTNGADVKDDGNGAYLTEDFWAKDTDGKYVAGKHIAANYNDITTYPYSGPYYVAEWNKAESTAVMKLNPYFKGDHEGNKPSIETISYVRMVQQTQNEWLTTGKLDILSDITGGAETNAALKILEDNPGKFASTYYDRAGYGVLNMRNDFGPVSDFNVRQAIAYSIDRNAFAQEFTGGYGSVVHGPYYAGSAAYTAVKDEILLNQYAVSESAAIAALEEGGWIYNAEGGEYTDGIRYKKLSKSEQSTDNLNYKSIDGAYKTVEVNGEYYMPLAINWYCTTDNDVSEMLKTQWAGSEITKNIGMNVQFTQGDFVTLMGELYQEPGYGYTGPALYCAFNMATGFTSAVYDYSYNWSIDPFYYSSYSVNYIKDAADILWLD